MTNLTIKIPKVESDKMFSIKILKMQTILYPESKHISLKKQEIAGITIPKGSIIRAPHQKCFFKGSGDEVNIKGELINPLLKFLFLEHLRMKGK